LSIAACAGNGNGNGLDANGQPLAAGSSGSLPPLSADFASIQANIFTPICSVCHVGGGAPEGLRLDAADSFNLLVGVPSAEVPSLRNNAQTRYSFVYEYTPIPFLQFRAGYRHYLGYRRPIPRISS
jgi:hypothetical protein